MPSIFKSCLPSSSTRSEPVKGRLINQKFADEVKERLSNSTVIFKQICHQQPAVIRVRINDHKLIACIFPSVSVTYCRSSLLQKLKLRLYEIENLSANGRSECEKCENSEEEESVPFLGYMNGKLWLKKLQLKTEILVAADDKDCPFDLMIGDDVIQQVKNKYRHKEQCRITDKHVEFGKTQLKIRKASIFGCW